MDCSGDIDLENVLQHESEESEVVSTKTIKNVAMIRDLPNFLVDQEITTFPFKINYIGEADLDAYLKPEDGENGVVSGTFRGRPLFGERVKPPQGFNTVTLTTNHRPDGELLFFSNT